MLSLSKIAEVLSSHNKILFNSFVPSFGSSVKRGGPSYRYSKMVTYIPSLRSVVLGMKSASHVSNFSPRNFPISSGIKNPGVTQYVKVFGCYKPDNDDLIQFPYRLLVMAES